MTRERGDDGLWRMFCDRRPACGTVSPGFLAVPDLREFHDTGWHVAKVFGDVCPACIAAGVKPTATPFDFQDPT